MKHQFNKTKSFKLALVLLAGCSNVYATDYATSLALDIYGKHDDNIRLQESDKTSVTGIVAAPSIALSADTETMTTSLNAKFTFSSYDDSDYNTNDQDINLISSKLLEHGMIGIDAGILRDSTLTSELLGSGVIGNKAERSERYSIAPYGKLFLNEQQSLTLRSSYAIRDYHSSAYQGYDDWSNSLTWNYQLSERWGINVVALYERINYDDISGDVPASSLVLIEPNLGFVVYEQGLYGQLGYSQEITSKGGQIGATYAFSESSSLSALIGRSYSKTNYPLKDPNNICGDDQANRFAPACFYSSFSDTITTAAVDWSWRNEIQQLQLNLTKSQQPTSSGYTIDATILRLNWSYSVSELNQLSLGVSGTHNQTLGSNQLQQNQADRDYVSGKLGYHHRISENWHLDTSYEYRYQTYKDSDYRADSNVISLGVSYHPQSRHWSR